eukprot:Skav224400  [mRNA]  locus=scaffold2452:244095:248198:- [translate_table: standard]
MGRTASKQERQEEILSRLREFSLETISGLGKYKNLTTSVELPTNKPHRGEVVGHMHQGSVCVAQEIFADRIKMEGKPTFDPRPYLDEDSRILYEHPWCQGITPDSLPTKPPRVRVHANMTEKIKLLKLLNKSGRVIFRKPDEIVNNFGNGLFCVPKNLGIDRLILDGRPANLLQEAPNKYILSMGSASALLGIFLRPTEKLLMSGDDLSNFFYTFKVGYERGTRNYLQWKINTHLVKDFPGFPPELASEPFVYAGRNSLAMGDSAACEYAQTSHLSLGLQSGALQPKSLLTLNGRLPRSSSMGGIIIDDFILMEKVLLEDTKGIQLEQSRDSMHNMYSAVGLDAHPTKGFECEESASFWGADVDGLRGFVRGTVSRAASLCWITAQVIEEGVATVGLLEVIAGGFVALFTFRRRLMSLLDLVYVAQGGRDQGDIIALSPQLKDELWSLCLLCPLAATDLRVPHSEEIFFVDASNWGEAVCSAEPPGQLKEELHRHGLVKSCWTKLLNPYKAYLREKGALPEDEQLPEGESSYSSHPLWEAAARGLKFKTSWKRHAKRKRRINVGELRSFLKAEALAGSRHGSIRVPIGGDSQVTAGAICKGRSASQALNRELRRSIPTVVGGGIYSCTGYVNTKHNPADDPTRGTHIREPDIIHEQWWHDAAEGNFEALDILLGSMGLDDHAVGGYADLSSLFPQNMSTLDPECKPRGTRMHRRVSERIRLRARCKASVNEPRVHKSDVPSSLHFEAVQHVAEVDPHEPPNLSPWSDDVFNDLLSFGHEAFVFAENQSWPPQVPGFLDLYSGRKGFAKASARLGAPWVLTIDIEDGAQFNLLMPGLRKMIWKLLIAGCFLFVSAAPVCSSFSRAITPAVRSREEPLGIQPVRPTMKTKIEEGNSHAAWLGSVIRWCILHRLPYWCENPDGSFLWLHPAFASLPYNAASRYMRVDFCHFGTPWRKRARFLCSGRLVGVRKLCKRDHKHKILQGRARGAKACWTKIAEPYPKALCSYLAWAVCSDLGLYRKKPGSPLPYRGEHRRIGEAKNPGPRAARARARAGLYLDDVELVRPEIMAIGSKQWELFFTWCVNTLGEEVAPSLWLAPGLMGHLMGLYGKHMFACGKALFNYRHLVVFAQREFAGLRGFLQPAWDSINRWEEMEPVEHRRPLPLAMVQALVGLAMSWSWYRVASVILIAFHGCCRPGEVIKGCRGQLVFPQDVSQIEGPIFYRIQKPKPGRRGMGRVQHTKIVPPEICAFLAVHLGDLDSDAFIYSGSAASFRTRWDKFMNVLRVPKSAGLTPSGLRAGGTVELYRRGTPIADILWTLRLKNIETLQHYLQEISTQITLVDLPVQCKLLVNGFSSCFPSLLSPSASLCG